MQNVIRPNLLSTALGLRNPLQKVVYFTTSKCFCSSSHVHVLELIIQTTMSHVYRCLPLNIKVNCQINSNFNIFFF